MGKPGTESMQDKDVTSRFRLQCKRKDVVSGLFDHSLACALAHVHLQAKAFIPTFFRVAQSSK